MIFLTLSKSSYQPQDAHDWTKAHPKTRQTDPEQTQSKQGFQNEVSRQ